MTFQNVQTKLRDAIAAHPYFAELTVFADVGLSSSAIDDQLVTAGACVVVAPPLLSEPVAQSKGVSQDEVTMLVQVMHNPEQAPTISVYEMAVAARDAALSMATSRGEPGFQCKGLQLSDFAQGLFAYDLTFTTQIRFQ
jgi:hypothetical protein